MALREKMDILDACICRLTGLYGEWAKQHGVSYNRMTVLHALHRGGGCTQKQITEEWLIPKQTVNSIIKDLERNGYVCCEQTAGKKEKRIFCTEAGMTYAENCLKGIYALEERAMERIGREQQKALIRSNLAYVQAFEEELNREA